MQLVLRQFPGLILLFRVNVDRILTAATVIAGLLFGAFVGSLIAGY